MEVLEFACHQYFNTSGGGIDHTQRRVFLILKPVIYRKSHNNKIMEFS